MLRRFLLVGLVVICTTISASSQYYTKNYVIAHDESEYLTSEPKCSISSVFQLDYIHIGDLDKLYVKTDSIEVEFAILSYSEQNDKIRKIQMFGLMQAYPDQLYVIHEMFVGEQYYFSFRPVNITVKKNKLLIGEVLEVSNVDLCR
jgi:hypothetical protein